MFGRDLNNNRYYPAPVNANDLNLLWDFDANAVVYSSPAIANDIMYIGSRDGRFYALNASVGARLWNFTTGGRIDSSAAVYGGVVYFGSWDGSLYALNASSGALLWSYTTEGNESYVRSSPAVSNGILFMTSGSPHTRYPKVYALNASSGAEIWNYTASRYIHSSPAVANGTVYVGSGDGKFYALDANTGHPLWEYVTDGGIWSSPAVANGVVYFGSRDGLIYALDSTSGAQLWNFTADCAVDSSPAVAEMVVFFGSCDGNIYALDAIDGAKIWNYTTDGFVTSSPATANDVIYIGSEDGWVYAFTGSNMTTSPSLHCGDTITADTTMINDLHNCRQGLILGSDDITLDCGGHTIDGIGHDIGLLVDGRKGINIKNCKIKEFGDGVYLKDSNDILLTGNHVSNNLEYGIHATNLVNSNILENHLFNNYGSLSVENSVNNLIEYNILGVNDGEADDLCGGNLIRGDNTGYDAYGILFNASCENYLSRNNITGTMYDVVLSGSGADNLLQCPEINVFIYNNFGGSNPSLLNYQTIDVNATSNWWGTPYCEDISDKIIDYSDDERYGIVYFNPVLAGPYPSSQVADCQHRAADIWVNPSEFNVSLVRGVAPTYTDYLTIGNNGSSDLGFNIISNENWLSATPSSSTVSSDQLITINISIDTDSLAAGTHATELIIQSNDPDENPLALPINLEIIVTSSTTTSITTTTTLTSTTSTTQNEARAGSSGGGGNSGGGLSSVRATCYDGIQNRDETGVDCGGTFCNPCIKTTISTFPASTTLPPSISETTTSSVPSIPSTTTTNPQKIPAQADTTTTTMQNTPTGYTILGLSAGGSVIVILLTIAIAAITIKIKKK